MLSIRLQRTGRKGHAQYRVVVQDSRQSPTSGKFIARLGHYDPHTKEVVIDKEKAETFLKNGAQPSPRVVTLMAVEKIAMPAWVKTQSDKRDKKIKNPEKLRRNQPKEEKVEEPAVAAEPAVAEEPAVETTATTNEEAPAAAPVEAVEEPAAEAKESEAPAAEPTETPDEPTEAAK